MDVGVENLLSSTATLNQIKSNDLQIITFSVPGYSSYQPGHLAIHAPQDHVSSSFLS